MLSTEFSSEQEALKYIEENEQGLFNELNQDEIKVIYSNGNTRIHIRKSGKGLFKVINRFEGDRSISDICKDMAILRHI